MNFAFTILLLCQITPTATNAVVDVVAVCEDKKPYETHGVVIKADQSGTVILTCAHGHYRSWSAVGQKTREKISGDVTIFDDIEDLAILKTKSRWRGEVLPISQKQPTLAERLIVPKDGGKIPRGWAVMYRIRWPHQPGHSGHPLLCDDGVSGILYGIDDNEQDYAYYTQQSAVARFVGKHIK